MTEANEFEREHPVSVQLQLIYQQVEIQTRNLNQEEHKTKVRIAFKTFL